MAMTASELRKNIYQLLDQVLETGVPLEIERKGQTLRIVPEDRPPKLDRITGREDFLVGDPDDIIHMDWSQYWKPFL